MAQQMNVKQVVNELTRTRDNLNKVRTALAMSDISDMSETQKVVNDIDTLLGDSDSLRNELMNRVSG